MQANLDIKRAAYPNHGYPLVPKAQPFVDVIYFFLGPDCYFSAISLGTSTTTAAEEVVRAIAAAENIDPRQGNWFDLMTPSGYRSLRPGEYQLKRLEIDFEEWNGPAYPAEVLEWRDPDGRLWDAMVFPARPQFHVVGWERLPCPRWLRPLFYRFIFVN